MGVPGISGQQPLQPKGPSRKTMEVTTGTGIFSEGKKTKVEISNLGQGKMVKGTEERNVQAAEIKFKVSSKDFIAGRAQEVIRALQEEGYEFGENPATKGGPLFSTESVPGNPQELLVTAKVAVPSRMAGGETATAEPKNDVNLH